MLVKHPMMDGFRDRCPRMLIRTDRAAKSAACILMISGTATWRKNAGVDIRKKYRIRSYDGQPDVIRSQLEIKRLRKTAFSKYYLGRKVLNGEFGEI